MVITYVYLATISTEHEAIWRIFNKEPCRPLSRQNLPHVSRQKTEAGLQSVSKPKTRFKNGSIGRLWVAAWTGTLFLGLHILRWKNLPFDLADLPLGIYLTDTRHLHTYNKDTPRRFSVTMDEQEAGNDQHRCPVSDQHPMPINMKCYRRFFGSIHMKKYYITVNEHRVTHAFM